MNARELISKHMQQLLTIQCKIKQGKRDTEIFTWKPKLGKTTGGGRRELIHYHLM